jgi:hypothetical protein
MCIIHLYEYAWRQDGSHRGRARHRPQPPDRRGLRRPAPPHGGATATHAGMAWSARAGGRLRGPRRRGRRGAAHSATGRAARRRPARPATGVHGAVRGLPGAARAGGLLPARLRGLEAPPAAAGRWPGRDRGDRHRGGRRTRPAVQLHDRHAPGILLHLDRGPRRSPRLQPGTPRSLQRFRAHSGSASPGGQGCTSDVVTPAEAALGLGAATLAFAVSLRLPRATVTTSRPSG